MQQKHPHKASLHRINDSKQLLLNSKFRKKDAFSVYLTFFIKNTKNLRFFENYETEIPI